MNSSDSFEKKLLPNGKQNPKYIDLLDEDPPIAGFKFVGLSFVSPEKILKQRELFIFKQFVKEWDFTKSMNKFNDFLQFISHKFNLNVEELMTDFNEFINEEKEVLKTSTFEDDFKGFIDKNEEKLNEKFNKEHNFQTSVRGLKVRCYGSTQEETELKCKQTRERDPNHDIFLAPVGVWVPFEPEPHKTGRVEYMEEELNQLHAEKIKNELKAKELFDTRIRDAKRKAIEENIKKALQSGNVLTQDLDENDNLIGVKETVNFDEREVAVPEKQEEFFKELKEKELEKMKQA